MLLGIVNLVERSFRFCFHRDFSLQDKPRLIRPSKADPSRTVQLFVFVNRVWSVWFFELATLAKVVQLILSYLNHEDILDTTRNKPVPVTLKTTGTVCPLVPGGGSKLRHESSAPVQK